MRPFVLERSYAEHGLTEAGPRHWQGERGGIPVEVELTLGKWAFVRFTARIDPPCEIDLRVGRLVTGAAAPGASLKESGFRISADDPERARALLGEAGAALIDATRCHHWIGVYDRRVTFSGYQYSDTNIPPAFTRNSDDQISESLDLVARIARQLSTANAKLGPLAPPERPPSPPRPVPRGATGWAMSLSLIFSGIALMGAVLAAVDITTAAAEGAGLFVGGAIAVAGWTVATILWIVYVRRSRLYSRGEPASAQVLSVERTFAQENNHFLWRYSYEYEDASGRRHTGDWTAVNAPDVGAEVWVLYDPRAPARSIPARR